MKFWNKLPRFTLTAIVLAVILYFTLSPRPMGGLRVRLFPHADKVIHAVMFGGLALSTVFDLCRRRVKTLVALNSWMAWSALFAVVAGGAVELLQGAMALGRGCDIWDFVADVVGVAVAVLIFAFWARKKVGC